MILLIAEMKNWKTFGVEEKGEGGKGKSFCKKRCPEREKGSAERREGEGEINI